VTVAGLAVGSRRLPPAAVVAGWLGDGRPALLAIDAPLGWPGRLGDALVTHMAGAPPLPADQAQSSAAWRDANLLFRRSTDRFIKARLGQQPLDVAADRIARAAFAALWLLDDLREATGAPLPLAWSREECWATHAIEVYPAGTLRAHGLPYRRYKEAEQRPARAQILAALQCRLEFACPTAPLLDDADILDAAICLLAASDFLSGRAMPPPAELMPVARREGWIWTRRPGDTDEGAAHAP
jgi:hypothetical protein